MSNDNFGGKKIYSDVGPTLNILQITILNFSYKTSIYYGALSILCKAPKYNHITHRRYI